jgi:hypothetical protein
LTGVHAWTVWTGTEFVTWGANANPAAYFAATDRVTSPDGVTWNKTPLTAPKSLGGPVAVSATGTFVAINNMWSGYDQQFFLRSSDGITWETLPTTAFVQSHPLMHLTFGYADPSPTCPLAPAKDAASE